MTDQSKTADLAYINTILGHFRAEMQKAINIATKAIDEEPDSVKRGDLAVEVLNDILLHLTVMADKLGLPANGLVAALCLAIDRQRVAATLSGGFPRSSLRDEFATRRDIETRLAKYKACDNPVSIVTTFLGLPDPKGAEDQE